jgi:hypothetical protein
MYRTIALAAALTLASCAMIPPTDHTTPQTPTIAFCGTNPNNPNAQTQANTLHQQAGIDATMGPCLPPDWATYSAANPGPRYLDPAGYMELVHINTAAGMTTYIYDARLWSADPVVRGEALAFWLPVAGELAGIDMGDEFGPAEWPLLVARWDVVRATVTPVLGVEPFTNHLADPVVLERALTDLPGTVLSFDEYDVPVSTALAARFDGRIPVLVCAVNAMTFPGHTATPAMIRHDIRAHTAAGCDRILVFGGVTPEHTAGFDTPSLVDDAGLPTPLAAGVATGAS